MNRLKIFSIWIAVVLCFTVIQNAVPQNIDRLPVLFENGQRSGISGFYRGELVYVSLEEFADLLSLRFFNSPKNKKLVLRTGSKGVKVTALNPFVFVDDTPYQMVLSPESVHGKIYVPLVLFLEVVRGILPADVVWEGNFDRLRIYRYRTNITGVEVEKLENGSFIRIITRKPFKVSHVTTSVKHNWLQVSIIGGILDSTQIASDNRQGIIQKIVPYQFESSAQLSFLSKRKIMDRRVTVDEREIGIALWHTTNINPVEGEPVPQDRDKWLIDRVIIDPGHGGRFPGTTGRTGINEKDVNLDIAKRLKKLLVEKLKVSVLMTREDDRHLDKTHRVDLEKRRLFANSKGGKLFVSIHCNGNKNRDVRGFSCYFLGMAKTKEALEVAEKENSVIEMNGTSEESSSDFQVSAHILNAIHQSVYLKESQVLAEMVNASLKRKTNIPQWHNGVHQAHFLVLVGLAMPHVLVESAFLTNKHEERLLRTNKFRQKVADGLYESIKQFKETYEKEIQ